MRIGIDASRAFGNERTGTENYSYQMIRHLLKLPEAKNHEWILYTRNSPITSIKGATYKDITIPYLWTQVGLAYQTWVDGLDVLWVPAHTLPVLRRPGLKTIVTIHGIEYEYLPAYENWLQRWYLPLSTIYACKTASKVIAVSQFTAKQLKERLEVDEQKITVIYEGVEKNTQSTIYNPQSTLKKYGLTSKGYILFIGTIQPRKNLKRLIEAYIGLKNSKISLVLVGKLGWGYEDLPIDKYSNVKFLRYINDAERDILLQNALVYVQPSITEGFGLPILEAFSLRVPVISSSGGALMEIADLKSQDSNMFNPYDVNQMKGILQRAIQDKAWRKQLTDRGIEKLKNFSWEKAAKMTYNMLVNNQ